MKIVKIIIMTQFLIIFFSFPLISQVSVSWVSRYNNGFSGDAGIAITSDDSGYVYVTGNSYGGPTRQDLVVLKYSPTGVTKWVQRIADTVNNNFMSGFDIEVDNYNEVYVGGSGMTKYDINGNLIWRNPSKSYNAIVLDEMGSVYGTGGSARYTTRKIDGSGNIVWERTYDTLDQNKPYDIVLDNNDNVIVTGRGAQTSSTGDYVTIKYSNSGNQDWIRKFNGGGNDIAYAVTTDQLNNVYVTGWNSNSNVDILTIKYSPTGDTIWKAVYDDGGGDIGYDIEVDSLGFVYVAGVTHSNDYVTLKYDRIGNLLWSRVQPSQLIPWNPTLKLDKYRNIYMSYVSYRTGNYENYAVVKYNNDGVQQWIGEYNNGGSSINIIYDMALDKNANVFVTGRSGGSMATVKFVQTPTAINQATNNYPEEFKLEQNYPNPFNPTTNLEFGIPSVRGKSNLEFVSLKVYDVLGNEVSTLVNEKKNAGRYEVEFDGSNFPSGIYFYSLTVDGIVIDTKRMILLK